MSDQILTVGSLVEVCKILSSPAPSNDELVSLSPFLQIYDCWMSSSSCKVPFSFRGKVTSWFSKSASEEQEIVVDRAENQGIVKVFNRWTCEDTVYCPERAFYELAKRQEWDSSVVQTFASSSESCDFCSPFQMTAEDPWGRVERPTCLTSSSIGKFDECHGMVVFRDHEPLDVLTELSCPVQSEASAVRSCANEEKPGFPYPELLFYIHLVQGVFTSEKPVVHLTDMLSCAREWFSQAHVHQSDATFPSLHWNFLPPAGASMYHGHAHLCLSSRRHVGYWERLQRVAGAYLKEHKRDYFADLIAAHECLGLCRTLYSSDKSAKAHLVLHLTPPLSHELLIITDNDSPHFAHALLHAIKDILHKHLGPAFMLAIYFPPLGMPNAKLEAGRRTSTMPLLARIVHRSSSMRKSDLCGRKALTTNFNDLDPVQFARLLNWPVRE